MPIKVFLVKDHDIVWQGVKALLENNPGTEVVGEAASGAEALEKIAAIRPEMVLVDVSMPQAGGLGFVRQIRRDHPEVKVLILSMHDHESGLAEMLDAGVQGYVLRNTPPDELLFAIRKIAGNGTYIGSEIALGMLARYRAANSSAGEKRKGDYNITEREQDVLNLIAEGYTNTEIANKLFTSVRTIETRRKKLLEKTNTVNTATLIRFAVLNGLIS